MRRAEAPPLIEHPYAKPWQPRRYRRGFRYVYKRDPSADELEACKRALHIERLRSFPRHWLSEQDVADLRAVGDVIEDAEAPPTPAQSPPPESSPALEPAPAAANGAAAEHYDRPRRRGGGYPRNAGQRAQTLLRARLANGPISSGEIEAEAETLNIPVRSLRQVAPTPTA